MFARIYHRFVRSSIGLLGLTCFFISCSQPVGNEKKLLSPMNFGQPRYASSLYGEPTAAIKAAILSDFPIRYYNQGSSTGIYPQFGLDPDGKEGQTVTLKSNTSSRTVFSIEFAVVEAAKIDFNWRVGSESNYDFLNFYINGVQKLHVSGSYTSNSTPAYFYVSQSDNINSGKVQLAWEYSKDSSGDVAPDQAQVSRIRLTDVVKISEFHNGYSYGFRLYQNTKNMSSDTPFGGQPGWGAAALPFAFPWVTPTDTEDFGDSQWDVPSTYYLTGFSFYIPRLQNLAPDRFPLYQYWNGWALRGDSYFTFDPNWSASHWDKVLRLDYLMRSPDSLDPGRTALYQGNDSAKSMHFLTFVPTNELIGYVYKP